MVSLYSGRRIYNVFCGIVCSTRKYRKLAVSTRAAPNDMKTDTFLDVRGCFPLSQKKRRNLNN